MGDDKNTRPSYQVWALLYNERGIQTWQPVTRPYQTKSVAVSISSSMWLETRVEQVDPEEA